MDIHRVVATSFVKPSVNVRCDLFSVFTAQTNKRLLNTVLGPIPIPVNQLQRIRRQRLLQAFKYRLQPHPSVLEGRLAVDRFRHDGLMA
jgi:hypothetical protein